MTGHVLAERIRAANPVPGPRPLERPRSRFTGRHALVLLAATLVVLGGVAAAFATFAPRYFGSSDHGSVSQSILAQLRSWTPEERSVEGGLGQVDPDGLVRLASFEAPGGLATIYAAPRISGAGFCEVHAVNDVMGGGGCYDDRSWQAFPHVVHHDSEWGDVSLFLGPLEAPVASIEVRFEDGSARTVSTSGSWWVYLTGGKEREPGHRPDELVAFDADGRRVASEQLDPHYFGRP
ncbi:MAG TPA: hypothetical protein VH650_03250 [Gaiellaceae bacterium]|jgi:hypothetical protein